MDMGSLLGTTSGTILNYKRDPYVHCSGPLNKCMRISSFLWQFIIDNELLHSRIAVGKRLQSLTQDMFTKEKAWADLHPLVESFTHAGTPSSVAG